MDEYQKMPQAYGSGGSAGGTLGVVAAPVSHDPVQYAGLIHLAKYFSKLAFWNQPQTVRHEDDIGPLYIKQAITLLENPELRKELFDILSGSLK